MSDKITVAYEGKGPGFCKKIEVDELSQYLEAANWKVVDDDVVADELSQDNQKVDENGNVVVELGAEGKSPAPEGHTVSIRPDLADQERLEKWFTDDEIEKIEQAELSQNPDKGEVANQSIDEMWREMEKEHRKKVYKPQVEEHYRKKRQEAIESNDWMKDDKYTESVKDLSGEQFVELMKEAQSGNVEELSAIPDDIEEQIEAEKPNWDIQVTEADAEVEELAIEGFKERAEKAKKEGEDKSYWQEIAKEIEMSRQIPDTEVNYTSDGERTRIKTKDPETVEELRRKGDSEFYDVTIERDTGDGIIAIVNPDEFGGE